MSSIFSRTLLCVLVVALVGCGAAEQETAVEAPAAGADGGGSADWTLEWPADKGTKPDAIAQNEACKAEVGASHPELDFDAQPVVAWKRMRECMEAKGWVYKQVGG